MELENTSMIPSPAIILGERIQPLDELANIALSSSSSSPSSYTPQKRKRIGPTNHGRVINVAGCGRSLFLFSSDYYMIFFLLLLFLLPVRAGIRQNANAVMIS
jgi:hypothetical protein